METGDLIRTVAIAVVLGSACDDAGSDPDGGAQGTSSSTSTADGSVDDPGPSGSPSDPGGGTGGPGTDEAEDTGDPSDTNDTNDTNNADDTSDSGATTETPSDDDDTGEPSGSAVERGLIARYTFEGEGSSVADVSGVGEPLDLTMYRQEYIERIDHGVRFLRPPEGERNTGPDHTTPIIRSAGSADKINDAVRASDAFTLEVWLRPTELEQSGPGRVVSIDFTNYDSTNFNAMHGPRNCGDHGADRYFQLRMGGSGNACPALPTPGEPNVTGELQHLVVTQDGEAWALYLDGEVSQSGNHGDTPSGWNTVAGLALGNLPYLPEEGAAHGNHRQWAGELYYVGWHDVALSAEEVQANASIPYAER